jgi:hypothetical protein
MKHLIVLIFILQCGYLSAAAMTVTANHVVDGTPGSIEFTINPSFAYPPFDVTLEGPNGLNQTLNDFPGFSHTFPGLGVGEYTLTVTNSIGCTASESIEIISCNFYGGTSLPAIVLCREKATTCCEGPYSYVISPSDIREGSEATEIEFRILSEVLISSTSLEETILSKSLQITYDIQLEGETLYDIPWQEEITDYSINLVIKYSASGDILWVYHKEAEEGATSRAPSKVKDAQVEKHQIECQVVPNPFAVSFEAAISSSIDAELKLYLLNLNGQVIEQRSVSCNKGELAKQSFSPNVPSGTYILKVCDSNNNSVAVKIIRM